MKFNYYNYTSDSQYEYWNIYIYIIWLFRQFHERKYQLPSTPLTSLNAPPTLLT